MSRSSLDIFLIPKEEGKILPQTSKAKHVELFKF
jgi:hypothetical protein